MLYVDGKISEHEIYSTEPESVDHPAQPIPFSYVEYYLPSNTALVRFGKCCQSFLKRCRLNPDLKLNVKYSAFHILIILSFVAYYLLRIFRVVSKMYDYKITRRKMLTLGLR